MQQLVSGIHRFQQRIFRPRRELFERLAHHQEPDALFITCSDSRISPNLITQTGPGDLFVLRNAGNLVPPHGAASGGEGATIEFAVGKLNIEDIIICGHSRCGAMKALLDPDALADLPSMRQWMSHAEATRRIIQEKYADLRGEDLLTATVEENVLVQLENLRTHPLVAARLAQNRLKLHAWVYELETGEMFAFDPDAGQFVPLTENPVQPTVAPDRLLRMPSI